MRKFLVSFTLVLSFVMAGLLSGMTEQERVKTRAFQIADFHESCMEAAYINGFENLLPCIAHIDACEKAFGSTLLEAAASSGNITVCRILLEHKANINGAAIEKNALCRAAENSHFNTMRFLLEMGIELPEQPPQEVFLAKKEIVCGKVTLEPIYLCEQLKVRRKKFIDSLFQEHRLKVQQELNPFLHFDTAGLVSEYVVRENSQKKGA